MCFTTINCVINHRYPDAKIEYFLEECSPLNSKAMETSLQFHLNSTCVGKVQMSRGNRTGKRKYTKRASEFPSNEIFDCSLLHRSLSQCTTKVMLIS